MKTAKLLLAAALVAASFAGSLANAAQTRILAYGDSNTYGWETLKSGKASRLPVEKTWPMVMQRALGKDFSVIAEGLSGRTTNLNRPGPSGTGHLVNHDLNGAAHLPSTLSSHSPLDLVIVMLGTNDMHRDFARSADEIALALGEIAVTVKQGSWQKRTDFANPQVLLVSPPKLDMKKSPFAPYFTGSKETSEALGSKTAKIADLVGVPFFDAASVVPYGRQFDEIHMNEEDHELLGKALAAKVKEIVGRK